VCLFFVFPFDVINQSSESVPKICYCIKFGGFWANEESCQILEANKSLFKSEKKCKQQDEFEI